MNPEQLSSKQHSLDAWRKIVENVWCRSQRWEVTTVLDTIQTLMNFQPIQIHKAEENKAITICFTNCRRLISFQNNVAPFLNRIQHHKVGEIGKTRDKITIFLEPIPHGKRAESAASCLEYALQKKDINSNTARRGYSISFGKVTQEIIHKFARRGQDQPQSVNNPTESLAHPLLFATQQDPLEADKIMVLEDRIGHLELLLETATRTSNNINDKKVVYLATLAEARKQCDFLGILIDEVKTDLLTS